MQDSNTQPRSVHLNLPADSLEAIAGRPKVPHDLYTSVEDWQTRILTILPGEDSAELCCELNIVDLVHSEGVIIHGTKHRLHYQALSYSWGYRPSTVRLPCNGQECRVSPSLEQALRALRRSDEGMHAWVDAFCINQADMVEKSQQIQSIRLIFAKAENVAIWLGDSEIVLRIKRLLNAMREGHDIGSKSTTLEGVLASCRWFHRSWVRQEVAAARHLVFVPQTTGLKFEHLCLRVENVDGHWWLRRSEVQRAQHIDDQLYRLDSNHAHAPLLHMMKSRLKSSEPEPFNRRALCLLMKSCLAPQATDPKDKVYGVLGLLSGRSLAPPDTQGPLLDVNYNKSVAEVYMDMTMYLLLTFQHLGALELHIPSSPNSYLLPSWVFNFESPPPQMLQAISAACKHDQQLSRSTSAGGVRCYHTSGGMPNIAPHSPVLVAYGHSVGTIRTVDRIPDSTYWRSANIEFHSMRRHQFFASKGSYNRQYPYQVNPLVEAGDTVVFLCGGNPFFALRQIASASDRAKLRAYRARADHQYYKFLGAISYSDDTHVEHGDNNFIDYAAANHKPQEAFHLV